MLPRRSTIKPLSDVSLHKTGSRPASHDGEAEDGGLAAMVPSLTVSPLDVDRGRLPSALAAAAVENHLHARMTGLRDRGVGDRSALWGMCSKSATSNGGRPLCDIASVHRTRDLDAPPHRDPQGEGAPPSYFPENGSPRGGAARFAASDFSGVFLTPTP